VSDSFSLHRAVVPLVRTPESDDAPIEFLGTAFYVDDQRTAMTAKHVVDGWSPGEVSVLQQLGNGTTIGVPVTRIWESGVHDIAVLDLAPFDQACPLELAQGPYPMNVHVATLEYSRSHPLQGAAARRLLKVVGSFRRGNIVRTYRAPWPGGGAEVETLELSYPALQGASGAAVFEERSTQVVGMVLGNVESTAQPALTLRASLSGTDYEERTYHLPFGLAISWLHLRIALEAARQAGVNA